MVAPSASPGPSLAIPARRPSSRGPVPPADRPASVATSGLPAASIRLCGERWATAVVMLVRAQRPSYWVGETFNTWNGESWSATNSATHTLRQQSPFILPLSTGLDRAGADGPADLLCRELHGEPRVSRAECHRAVVPRFEDLRLDGRDDRLADRHGEQCDLFRRVRGDHSHGRPTPCGSERRAVAGRRGSVLPPAPSRLPTGGGTGEEDHRGGYHQLRQGRVADRLDGRPHPLLHGYSTPPRRRRHRGRVPVRQSSWILRADLHVTRRHVAVDRSPHPRSRRLRARARTIRITDLYQVRATMPMPGSRCGFRASDGRASIPPPSYRWPIRHPERWPSTTSAMHSDGSRSCRLRARCSASTLVATFLHWRRSRPLTWAERIARGAPSGRAGGPGVPAAPTRHSASTPPHWTT